jgi:hypothetical protein
MLTGSGMIPSPHSRNIQHPTMPSMFISTLSLTLKVLQSSRGRGVWASAFWGLWHGEAGAEALSSPSSACLCQLRRVFYSVRECCIYPPWIQSPPSMRMKYAYIAKAPQVLHAPKKSCIDREDPTGLPIPQET